MKEVSAGTLYLVGTPIGNLEDITLRAVRTLREVDLIAAEDTRTTRHLLTAYDIHTPLTSYHDFTGPGKTRRLVRLLEEGKNIALVSEAGMPGISDPGFALIRAAIEANIRVTAAPGPSAITTALALSGLPAHRFCFLGFLPRKSGDRKRLLAAYSEREETLVMFESPHRILASLQDLAGAVGRDRPMAAARELTKKHEEIIRGSVAEVIEHLSAGVVRGEFTLVVGGKGSG